MNLIIEEPNDCFRAENIAAVYFSRMHAGLKVNGKILKIAKNNEKNIFDIDWAIYYGDTKIAVIDTEYKPKWLYGYYPRWTVARQTLKYNQGNSYNPQETVKTKYYRQYPDESFWMPIRSDYREAGITTGRVVVESPIITRVSEGMARPIELFEFSCEKLVFGKPFETELENYVILMLEKARAYEQSN